MESNELGTVEKPVREDSVLETTATAATMPANKKHRIWMIIFPIAAVLFLAGIAAILLHLRNQGNKANQTAQKSSQSQAVDLTGISPTSASFSVSEKDKVVFNGQIQATQGIVLQPTDEPTSPSKGQVYIDSKTSQLRYYNGTEFVTVASQEDLEDLLDQVNEITAAGGIGTTTTGVQTLQGSSGAVTISGSNGLTVNNSGSNISISLPQDLTTTASPTFAGLTLTGTALPVSSGGTGLTSLNANSVLVTNGSGGVVSAVGGVSQCLVSDAGPGGIPGFGSCSGTASVASVNGYSDVITIANASTGSLGSGTITIDDASTSQKGIVQFNSTNFTVSSGTANLSNTVSLGGTLAVATLGSASNVTYLCRNGSNQIATCATTGTGAAYTQGGNSFGATALFGTNDNNDLAVRTNGTTRLTISSTGNITQSGSGSFSTGTGNVTLNGNTTISGSNTFTSGTGAVQLNGNTTIGTDSLAGNKQFNVYGSSTFKVQTTTDSAFLVQNSGGSSLLAVQTNQVTNMILNSNFDTDNSGSWAWAGSHSGTAVDATVAYNGDASLVPGSGSIQVTNPSSQSGGVSGAVYFASLPAGTYTMQATVRRLDNKNHLLKWGYITGADLNSRVEGNNTYKLTLTDNWLTTKAFTFTVGGGGATGIYFRTSTNDGTFALDKVILQNRGSILPDSSGRINLAANTQIQTDSDSAFFIQNQTTGYNLLNFNTNQGTLIVRTTANDLSALEVHNADDDSVFAVTAGAAGNVSGWKLSDQPLYYRTSRFQAAKYTTNTGDTYAYVIGGNCTNGGGHNCPEGNSNPSSQVQYAKLDGSGHEVWRVGYNSGLPAREDSAVVAAKGHVYVIGGHDISNVAQSDVYYNTVNSDGSFTDPWQTTSSFTNTGQESDGNNDSARSRIQAVYYNDYIYVIGGQNLGTAGNPALDTIIRAKVFANGQLGPWTFDSKLPHVVTGGPHGISRYAAAVYKGRIYLIGGTNDSGVRQNIFLHTTITGPSGALDSGGWVNNTGSDPLPIAAGQLSAVADRDYLYVAGGNVAGGPSGSPVSTVYYAHIATDGSIDNGWSSTPGQMQDSSGVYQKRQALSTLIYGGKLYVIGGISGSTQNTVLSADLSGTSSKINANASLKVTGKGTFEGGLEVTTATNTDRALVVTNDSGGDLLNIDTALNKVTLGGQNTATINNWHPNKEFLPVPLAGSGSTVLNGYVYVISGSSSPKIYYSKLKTDGSIGAWTDNSSVGGADLPDYKNFNMTIAANGYIYVIGGVDSGGTTNTVYFARPNLDGSIPSWKTSSVVLETAVSNAAVTVANGYLYIIGGDQGSNTPSTKVQYAGLRPDGTLSGIAGEFFEDSSQPLPSARRGNRAIFANGYLYVTGGQNNSLVATNTVYSASLDTDGSISAAGWTSLSNVPSEPRAFHTSVIANGYIYEIAGRDGGGNATNTVYYSKIIGGGDLGEWASITLPDDQDQISAVYNHTSVIANGFVYVMGGFDDTNAALDSVYYGSTARVSVGGSLDLVGLGSQTLSDSGGGGQLTAGNTTIVGSLDVRDSASFGQSVVINSTFTAHGDVLLQSDQNSSTAFQIQNANGDSIFNVNAATGQVEINGDVVLGSTNIIHANYLNQTAVGQDITIDAGSDDIIFKANGRTFVFPTTGDAVQEICTTNIICTSGAGQAVLFHPNSAQENNSADAGIFIDATSTGALIQLQSNGTDAVVVDSSGTLILGTANQLTGQIVFNDGNSNFNVTLNTATLTGNRTFSFPNESSGEICVSTGNCAGVGGSVTTSGGTANYIAKFTSSGNIEESNILDNGTTVSIQGSGGLGLGISNSLTGQAIFYDGSSVNNINLQSTSLTASHTIYLPDSDGIICTTTSGGCTGGNSGATLQNAYNSGNSITASDNRDILFTMSDTTTDPDFVVNLQGTGNDVRLQQNGTNFVTFSGNGTTTITTNSATAFLIQQTTSSSTNLFTADTTNKLIKIGNGTPTLTSTTNGGLYVRDSAEFAGRIVFGTTNGTTVTSGVDIDASNHQIRFVGTARNQVTYTLMPEYAGAVLNGTDAGTMTADFCSSSSKLNVNASICSNTSDEFNYYSWTTAQSGSKFYNVYIKFRMPSDYDQTGSNSGFTSNNSIKMYQRGSTSSDNIEFTLFNAAGGSCVSATVAGSTQLNATTWTENSLAGNETTDSACVAIQADDVVTIRLKMTATQNNFIYAGPIKFTYYSKF